MVQNRAMKFMLKCNNTCLVNYIGLILKHTASLIHNIKIELEMKCIIAEVEAKN